MFSWFKISTCGRSLLHYNNSNLMEVVCTLGSGGEMSVPGSMHRRGYGGLCGPGSLRGGVGECLCRGLCLDVVLGGWGVMCAV